MTRNPYLGRTQNEFEEELMPHFLPWGDDAGRAESPQGQQLLTLEVGVSHMAKPK